MPSYVIPPNALLQAIIRGKHEGQDVMSVFTYRYTGSSPIADGAAMLDLFWNRWNTLGGMLDDYCNALVDKVTNIETRLQFVKPDRFAYVVKTELTRLTGAVSDSAYPTNTAVAITKRCINAGRNYVGTLHMPGVPTSFIGNGALSNIAVPKYAALIEEMLKEITTLGTAATFIPVLFKKDTPELSPRFVNCTLQGFARVERRRTVGLGA